MAARITILVVAVVFAVSACGATSTPTPSPTPGPTGTPTLPSEEREAVEQAVRDLAAMLKMPPAEISEVSAIAIEMAVQDLGCPTAPRTPEVTAPGLVMGREVVLVAGGRSYVYHVYQRRVVLCPTIGGRGATPQDGSDRAVASALRDLRTRLSVPEGDIQVTRVEAREWSDTSLGCPESGKVYAQVITPGFLVVLQAAGKTYEYHSDRVEARLCTK